MTSSIKEVLSKLDEINNIVQQLFGELEGKDVPKAFSNYSGQYIENWTELNRTLEDNSSSDAQVENIIKSLASKSSALGASLLQSGVSNHQIQSLAKEVSEKSSTLIKMINNTKTTFDLSRSKIEKGILSELYDNETPKIKEHLLETISNFEAERKRNSTSLANIQNQIESLDQKSEKISLKVNEEIEKIKKIYAESESYLANKKIEVDELAESISKDVFSGNYEKRASKEEMIADKLRTWSLISMIAAILVIIITVVEASFHNYTWTTALLRLGLIFAVSVPAAYLARESSKHRDKQNSYLQKSLDLKAISPFISSLDKTDQDKIKINLSDKLFASTEKENHQNDELPLNAVEAISKILSQAKTYNQD